MSTYLLVANCFGRIIQRLSRYQWGSECSLRRVDTEIPIVGLNNRFVTEKIIVSFVKSPSLVVFSDDLVLASLVTMFMEAILWRLVKVRYTYKIQFAQSR